MTTPAAAPRSSTPRSPGWFAATRWTVVLAAGGSHSSRAQAALAQLCRTYWYPLYGYVRRRSGSVEDAEDLTQEFFARMIERQTFAAADPERGKFRSYILTALKNFLATEWHKAQAQKRGGGREILSLDLAAAARRFDQEPADTASPDRLFDRQWALALLNEVLARLEAEYRDDGKGELFAALKETLIGARAAQPYAALGVRLGLNENAVKVAVHRLRRRYRALLEAEIAETVASPVEAAEEMQHLLRVLGGS
jgi:RNA polymerase sigma-70 factor (ECF subfamily)